LNGTDWANATRTKLPGDASTRRYERLAMGDETALLMIQPEPALRTEYAERAQLAGNNPLAVVALTEQLTQRGFSAPKVIAADLGKGLVLLEDLGDALLAPVLEASPAREAELYGRAVDTLAALYRSTFPAQMEYKGESWQVGTYDKDVLLTEADLLLEWYAPDRSVTLTDAQREAWRAAWTEAFKALDVHAPGLILRDFHAENLFALDHREHEAATGLIDFQDALFGHPAYDLASLLEDARRDVDPAIVPDMIARFLERARIPDTPDFHAAYAVIGAQRSAKILGIFVRLAERDKKPRYRDLLPRVEAHFQNSLRHPALSRVKAWWEATL
jgi:aminoglycoside/choline kinase family phosphotransferase